MPPIVRAGWAGLSGGAGVGGVDWHRRRRPAAASRGIHTEGGFTSPIHAEAGGAAPRARWRCGARDAIWAPIVGDRRRSSEIAARRLPPSEIAHWRRLPIGDCPPSEIADQRRAGPDPDPARWRAATSARARRTDCAKAENAKSEPERRIRAGNASRESGQTVRTMADKLDNPRRQASSTVQRRGKLGSPQRHASSTVRRRQTSSTVQRRGKLGSPQRQAAASLGDPHPPAPLATPEKW